ncbi:MAG TPA: sigma-70 family RNA polymerase sigma factor [Candidatus Acidoferrales bacterium]|nr:sigma-70 family RNA polymerase sigma factor [Candidatus Acidoferrales bacterium]
MTATGESFPLTRLSVLAAARSQDAAERARALDILFAAYWKPVYKYICLKFSQSAQDAQDLTQGFFAELLERELLSRFDPAKSRLRSYLRLCADSFALNEIKAASRKKRGGEFVHVALDFFAAEAELRAQAVDPASIASPESLEDFFEKEWIRSLFSSAVEELRGVCEAREKQKAFQLFEAYDLSDEENVSYAELAASFALPLTEVNNQLAWARREFRRIALERLHALCGSEEEFAREAKTLFGVSTQ